MEAMQQKKWPRFIRKLVLYLRRASLPGFDKVPMWDVFSFFFRGLKNGALTPRASAIAYNFFLAAFPAIIVLFTIIPYIPIENFQDVLLTTIKDFLPINVFYTVKDTVEEIVLRKRTDLLSIGFLFSLIFATNGISAMIVAFNASYHHVESRKWIYQQLVAILLVWIFVVLIAIAVLMIITSGWVINYLEVKEIISNKFLIAVLKNGKWIIILGMIFLGFSSLYYLAPARRQKFRFISAGSTLATLFMILTSVGLSAYLNNFGQYNKLFGSIGTLMGFLIWIYANSLVILIGFELNASIKNARINQPLQKKK